MNRQAQLRRTQTDAPADEAPAPLLAQRAWSPTAGIAHQAPEAARPAAEVGREEAYQAASFAGQEVAAAPDPAAQAEAAGRYGHRLDRITIWPSPGGGHEPGGHEPPYRAEMERSFGQDFSALEVFLGRDAEMDALGAEAATHGDRIAFASPNPSREVVAHELTHVVQQRRSRSGGRVQAKSLVSRPGDAAEREADRVAAEAAAGHPVQVTAAPTADIQLKSRIPYDPTNGWPAHTTTALTNTFGKFVVTHGMNWQNRYQCDIKMDPTSKVGKSKVNFLQVCRTGDKDNIHTSLGEKYIHNEDTAVRTDPGSGFRVDKVLMEPTPFFGQSASGTNPEGEYLNRVKGQTGEYHRFSKNAPATLIDQPGGIERLKGGGAQSFAFEAIATAMDTDTGREFGSVVWGFQIDAEGAGADLTKVIVNEDEPYFLEEELSSDVPEEQVEAQELLAGRNAAYGVWNSPEHAAHKMKAVGQAVEPVPGVGVYH